VKTYLQSELPSALHEQISDDTNASMQARCSPRADSMFGDDIRGRDASVDYMIAQHMPTHLPQGAGADGPGYSFIVPLARLLDDSDENKYREESERALMMVQNDRLLAALLAADTANDPLHGPAPVGPWFTAGINVAGDGVGLVATATPLLPASRYRFRVRFKIVCSKQTLGTASWFDSSVGAE